MKHILAKTLLAGMTVALLPVATMRAQDVTADEHRRAEDQKRIKKDNNARRLSQAVRNADDKTMREAAKEGDKGEYAAAKAQANRQTSAIRAERRDAKAHRNDRYKSQQHAKEDVREEIRK